MMMMTNVSAGKGLFQLACCLGEQGADDVHDLERPAEAAASQLLPLAGVLEFTLASHDDDHFPRLLLLAAVQQAATCSALDCFGERPAQRRSSWPVGFICLLCKQLHEQAGEGKCDSLPLSLWS